MRTPAEFGCSGGTRSAAVRERAEERIGERSERGRLERECARREHEGLFRGFCVEERRGGSVAVAARVRSRGDIVLDCWLLEEQRIRGAVWVVAGEEILLGGRGGRRRRGRRLALRLARARDHEAAQDHPSVTKCEFALPRRRHHHHLLKCSLSNYYATARVVESMAVVTLVTAKSKLTPFHTDIRRIYRASQAMPRFKNEMRTDTNTCATRSGLMTTPYT
jgi:hypothetical protein